MSKLEELFVTAFKLGAMDASAITAADPIPALKECERNAKALMQELIGEDDSVNYDGENAVFDSGRNHAKAELRHKVEYL